MKAKDRALLETGPPATRTALEHVLVTGERALDSSAGQPDGPKGQYAISNLPPRT